jgi:hypothetical protein
MGRNRSNATAPAVKGNLVAGTGADTSGLLTVGANGTVLTADSAEATGIKWGTISAGGMTLLSTTSLSGASVTISSINQSYTNLYIAVFGVATGTTAVAALRLAPNGAVSDTSQVTVQMAGGSTQTDNINSQYLFLSNNSGSNKPRGNNSNNAYALQIYNYASTTARKPFQVQGGFVDDFSSNFRAYNGSGAINSTSAITSVTISTDSASAMASGTVLIYGVK